MTSSAERQSLFSGKYPTAYVAPVAITGLCLLIGLGCSDGTSPDTTARPEPELLTFEIAGVPPMEVPEDNPTTVRGVALGRRLFYDPILSGDRTLSCAGCHLPDRAFADENQFSLGIDEIEGSRNAPAIINAGWFRELFWDGRAADLEGQALQPVENVIEMHLTWREAVERLAADPEYPKLFFEAFGDGDIKQDLVVKAIAQFERSMISKNAKFDRWWVGDENLTESELNGFTLFFSERGDCFHCHGTSPLFTDLNFHNVGLDPVIIDRGRFDVTGEDRDMGLFKTPTLRNVEHTAPYMHDGRFETLEDVVGHYNSGGHWSPTVDPLIRINQGLGLTDSEVRDLVAFLKTLTDTEFLTNPAFQNPFLE